MKQLQFLLRFACTSWPDLLHGAASNRKAASVHLVTHVFLVLDIS